ncbi:hypothetical protein RI367_007176 [Sorochytrium milnesiophthora]
MSNSTKTSGNAILRAIQRHYTTGLNKRSEKQLLAEESLWVSSIPFRRWFLLPCALIIQFCCGSLYAWSVYNKPIESVAHFPHNSAQVTFYVAYGSLGFSAAMTGPWLERNGPRKAAVIGATLFLLGGFGAALAVYTAKLWLLYLMYGVIGGSGLGMSYISPVSALQKWFPDRRGLSAGFAVCGFGAGSIAAAPLQTMLIASVGVPRTFIILHSCYFVLMVLAATVLRAPPPNYVVAGLTQEGHAAIPLPASALAADQDIRMPSTALEYLPDEDMEKAGEARMTAATAPATHPPMTFGESARSRDFHLIYVMMLANCLAGLVMLSKLAGMVQDLFHKSADQASFVVSVNGGFNLLGRLGFSLLSDTLGRKTVFQIGLTIQVCVLASLPAIVATQNYTAFVAVIWLLTSAYGGGFGTIPAFLADMFGACNVGALHGLILTAWSFPAIGGGLLFTYLLNTLPATFAGSPDYALQQTYRVNYNWFLVIASLGWLATPFIRTRPIDRLLPNQPGEWARLRVANRLVRIGSFGVRSYSDAQLMEEWRDHIST